VISFERLGLTLYSADALAAQAATRILNPDRERSCCPRYSTNLTADLCSPLASTVWQSTSSIKFHLRELSGTLFTSRPVHIVCASVSMRNPNLNGLTLCLRSRRN